MTPGFNMAPIGFNMQPPSPSQPQAHSNQWMQIPGQIGGGLIGNCFFPGVGGLVGSQAGAAFGGLVGDVVGGNWNGDAGRREDAAARAAQPVRREAVMRTSPGTSVPLSDQGGFSG